MEGVSQGLIRRDREDEIGLRHENEGVADADLEMMKYIAGKFRHGGGNCRAAAQCADA